MEAAPFLFMHCGLCAGMKEVEFPSQQCSTAFMGRTTAMDCADHSTANALHLQKWLRARKDKQSDIPHLIP